MMCRSPYDRPRSPAGRSARSCLGLFSLLLLLAGAPCADAILWVQTNTFRLAEGEALREEAWMMTAGDVALDGRVERELFLYSGGTVTLRGTASDDVWVAGHGVRLTGSVSNHLRAAGMSSVIVAGSVGDGFLGLAPTVKIDTGAVVQADAVAAGEHVLFEGRVGGDARIMAGKATVGGRIGGTLHVQAADIVVLPGTVIEGDLVYRGDRELILDRSVDLRGEQIRRKDPPPAFSGYLLPVFFLFNAFLFGVLQIVLFPGPTVRAAALVQQQPWRVTLVGIALGAILGVAVLLAMLLGLTLMLGAVLAMAGGLLLYAGRTTIGLVLGSLIWRRTFTEPPRPTVGTLGTGLLFLYLFMEAPLLGGIVWLLSASAGAGAVALAFWQAHGRGRHSPPSDSPSDNRVSRDPSRDRRPTT